MTFSCDKFVRLLSTSSNLSKQLKETRLADFMLNMEKQKNFT